MAVLEVLGMGCGSCVGLFKNAEEAVRQEGRSDRVEKVTDYNRILALDPWALPALAIDGKVVVAGCLATTTEIRRLLVTNLDGSNLSAHDPPETDHDNPPRPHAVASGGESRLAPQRTGMAKANARRLADNELAVVTAWIDSGAE